MIFTISDGFPVTTAVTPCVRTGLFRAYSKTWFNDIEICFLENISGMHATHCTVIGTGSSGDSTQHRYLYQIGYQHISTIRVSKI